MPTLPRPQCATYQCKATARPGSAHCVDHAPAPRINKAKRETDREYNGATWANIRAGQLTRQPLCQCCKLSGRIVAGAHVDHVFPWKRIGAHAFTWGPFQTLCGPCHSTKTGLETRGVFRHYTDTGAVDYSPTNPPPDMYPPDMGRV